jgi:ribosomal 50S subunit-recycling heat shock protein
MRVKLKDVKVGDEVMIGMGMSYFKVKVLAQSTAGVTTVVRTEFGKNEKPVEGDNGFLMDSFHEADIIK